MRKTIILLLSLGWMTSCKEAFLDAKSNDALIVPTTVAELQALMDNPRVMNGYDTGPNPECLIAATDDYYISDQSFTLASQYAKNIYSWATNNVYAGETIIKDYADPYKTISYTNIVLEGLQRIENDQSEAYLNLKGSALFFRGYSHYQLAQVFAPAYDASTSSRDMGVPIRLTSDISEKAFRSTVEQNYQQIISDVKAALPLLPEVPLYKTRPSKPAAYGFLARVYQTMGNHAVALAYADSCLSFSKELLDFNALNPNSSSPIARFNEEVLLEQEISSSGLRIYLLLNTIAIMDSNLVKSYTADDLRSKVFITANPVTGYKHFKGSFNSTQKLFCGIARDEIYLIKAESQARIGQHGAAAETLNSLLKTRWAQGKYQDLIFRNPDEALETVLVERRKELVFRGLRWTDLKRLNLEPKFSKAITRTISGVEYILPANDIKYSWPIPDEVIALNPDMPQNPR